MAIAKTGKWTRENIMELTPEELFELWKQCPAAQTTELVGEYDGLIPTGGDERWKSIAESVFDENSQSGYWLGKCFWPLSKTKVDGYNRFRRPGGKIELNTRFATEVGTSLIDGKPSLMLYYGAYHVRHLPPDEEHPLIDEVRKLANDIYLGMGTIQQPDGSRSNPGHFLLVGPVGESAGLTTPPKN